MSIRSLLVLLVTLCTRCSRAWADRVEESGSIEITKHGAFAQYAALEPFYTCCLEGFSSREGFSATVSIHHAVVPKSNKCLLMATLNAGACHEDDAFSAHNCSHTCHEKFTTYRQYHELLVAAYQKTVVDATNQLLTRTKKQLATNEKLLETKQGKVASLEKQLADAKQAVVQADNDVKQAQAAVVKVEEQLANDEGKVRDLTGKMEAGGVNAVQVPARCGNAETCCCLQTDQKLPIRVPRNKFMDWEKCQTVTAYARAWTSSKASCGYMNECAVCRKALCSGGAISCR